MRKLCIVLFAIVLVASMASAQQFWGQGRMSWGGGLELSLPLGNLGDWAGFGFGPFGKFQYGVNDNILLTGSLGYTYWTKKDQGYGVSTSASAVTLLVGGKYNLSAQVTKGFYGLGEIGLYFGSYTWPNPFAGLYGGAATESVSETNFVFVPGAGYEFGNFDVCLKFVLGSNVSNIAARVAYQLPIQQ
jgi:hypothetical protein